jgi:aminomethyltransferase
VNWKLLGLRCEPEAPVPGPGDALIKESKTVGEITSACYSPALARPIALAYVRREVAEPGTRLLLATGAAGEVCALPFWKRRESAPA